MAAPVLSAGSGLLFDHVVIPLLWGAVPEADFYKIDAAEASDVYGGASPRAARQMSSGRGDRCLTYGEVLPVSIERDVFAACVEPALGGGGGGGGGGASFSPPLSVTTAATAPRPSNPGWYEWSGHHGPYGALIASGLLPASARVALVTFPSLPPHLHAPLSPPALGAVSLVFEFAPARAPGRAAPPTDRVVFALAPLADVLRALLAAFALGLRSDMAGAAAGAMEPGAAAAAGAPPRTRAFALALPLYVGRIPGPVDALQDVAVRLPPPAAARVSLRLLAGAHAVQRLLAALAYAQPALPPPPPPPPPPPSAEEEAAAIAAEAADRKSVV